jgi:hypothetical protein
MAPDGEELNAPVTPAAPKRRLLVGLVALVAIIVIVGVVFVALQTQSNKTVKLPDNHSVTLGASTSTFKQQLDNKVSIDADGTIATYPSDVKLAENVQAIFTIADNKVVGARYYSQRFDGDTISASSISVDQLKKQYGSKLVVLDKSLPYTGPIPSDGHTLQPSKLVGYMMSDASTNTYFMIDPCGEKTRIVTTIVTLKNYNDTTLGTTGVGCNVSGH